MPTGFKIECGHLRCHHYTLPDITERTRHRALVAGGEAPEFKVVRGHDYLNESGGRSSMKWIREWIGKLRTVPVYLGGIIPSHPDNPNSGAKIVILTEYGSEPFFIGKSDENGEFHLRIPRRFIGKALRFIVRNSAFLYDHDFAMVVQPWGVFHSFRMTLDRNNIGEATKADLAFADRAVDEYLKAEANTQFAARNEVNRTRWFWMAIALGLVTALIATGLPTLIGFVASAAALAIRAYLTNRVLGLSSPPIHPET